MLVLPTRRDSCSLVVLEALASGLPVITTRTNGAADVMTDGREGIILDRWDDVASLATALAKVSDRASRQAMRAAALALGPAVSWESHIRTLAGLYAEVANSALSFGTRSEAVTMSA